MAASIPPIEDVLGPGGLLARVLKNFEVRPSQLEMALLIEEALQEKCPAIIEAGTGTGKTLSYLVPALLSGKKTVISTGTKNLQEQIFLKDIPLLSRATGITIDAVLMKGRKNYLCLHRYERYLSQPSPLSPSQGDFRERMDEWLKKSEFADRSELSWLKDDDPLWDELSCASEQCLGSNCIHWDDCYLNLLRKKAAQSRMIIVNHHLFFADLMLKRGGFGEVIPRFQAAIFDEAHKVEETATTHFGESLSSNQLFAMVNDMEREMTHSPRIRDLKKHLDSVRSHGERLREMIDPWGDKGRLDEGRLRLIDQEVARPLGNALACIQEMAERGLPENGGFYAFALRAQELKTTFERILSFDDVQMLNWFEKRVRSVVLHVSPLDISQHMQEKLYQRVKTTIFTSATLSTNGNFEYIRSRLGLSEKVLEGIYPSHFDYQKQALMYIPVDLPPPSSPAFPREAGKRILDILLITTGRGLVLFTSHHNLNYVHRLLQGKIPFTILKQGEAPKSILLESFRKDVHSVLLATGSFWEGVDVPGDALSCLIIDKLPFDSPGEPLVSARIQSIRAQGRNAFMEYQLPAAIISLKQGLGRLIRDSSDQGILAVLDLRMMKSNYGRFFLASLPEMHISHDLSDVRDFFQ
jgi:ATP-dependent DNA helicase DinG